eukprot:1833740-Rhodomonas_salina.1
MLEALGVGKARHAAVLRTVARASAQGLHLLHLCRHARARAPPSTTLLHKRQDFAREVWGPAPPCIAATH